MANNKTITISGLDEVIKALEKRGDNVTKALDEICTVAAEILQDEIESNATGSIASSIVIETEEKSKSKVSKKIGASKKKWYAHFVEYGTRAHIIPHGVINGQYRRNIRHPGARAKPFMRPAFDTKKEAAITAVGKEIQNKVESN